MYPIPFDVSEWVKISTQFKEKNKYNTDNNYYYYYGYSYYYYYYVASQKDLLDSINNISLC